MFRYLILALAAALLLSGCAGAEEAPTVTALSVPVLPEQAPYPDESQYMDAGGSFDSEGFSVAYDAWRNDQQERDYADSAALAATKASVLHTTPYRSYPSGVTATASKRHEYISWAKGEDRYIIEDDYESEFSVSTKPTETLFALSHSHNVIYLNTFSKTISPSLRIGYMVLPDHLVRAFEEKLGFYSCTVPTFMQYVLTELINNGDFERHINRVRRKKRKGLGQ